MGEGEDPPDIDWIVEKASELLVDMVEDGPLKDEDIDLAFEMFAEPRLERISDSFESESEYEEATDDVRNRLERIAEELNEDNWSD